MPNPKAGVTLWTHANSGYIKVDHDMQTSLKGLWAVGSDVHNGSSWNGASTAPGFRGQGLLNAAVTGIIGGTPAMGKCLEAKSFALHAELFYTSSFLRTESRGWHYREDYPERNDQEWAKWITLINKNGTIKHRIDPIPEAAYKIKP